MIRALAAAALLPLAAAASDPLAGRVAGPMQSCLSISRTAAPEIIDGKTILYRDGARIYRAQIDACPGLTTFSTLIVEVYGPQMCRGDRFRAVTLPSSIPSAYCRFRGFVPYTKVKARTG
ncbi:hypothetical protein [Sphingomonas sp.]|jgi:hypothetical protein|uniref:hypothetical protein n=1 Tax=Sphingomonas sp. TaxID=28214 RepID=UPI002EDA141B